MNEIGNKPQTLKFTQNSSDWVLHITSFNIAKKKKKYIHLFVKIYQPSFFINNDFPKNFFNKGSDEKNFPKIKVVPNNIFTTVGLIYIKIGLSK